MRATLIVLVSFVTLVSCSDQEIRPGGAADTGPDRGADGSLPPDSGPDTGPNCSQALPALTLECSQCHSMADLEAAEGEGQGPREWMTLKGHGLVRVDPAFPAPGVRLDVPWVRRGHHTPQDLADCSGCHPLRPDGLGHSVKTSPADNRARIFNQGGISCGGSCHVWLTDALVARGFDRGDKPALVYEGSGRPEALLDGSANAHRTMWKEGRRPEGGGIKIAAFNPGCGGCHQVQSEEHGTVPSCLTCHSFGGATGDLHQRHVELAEGHWQEWDPGRPAMSSCAYCHHETEEAASRSNGACYNCHLSGHQPLDAQGRAHFWPVEGN